MHHWYLEYFKMGVVKHYLFNQTNLDTYILKFVFNHLFSAAEVYSITTQPKAFQLIIAVARTNDSLSMTICLFVLV